MQVLGRVRGTTRWALLLVLLAPVLTAGWQQGGSQPTQGTPQGPRQFAPPPMPIIPEPEMLAPPPPLDKIAGDSPSVPDQYQALLGRTPQSLPPPPVTSVIRAILGLAALTVLAYLGGSAAVRAFEMRFGVAHLATTGLPYALLGLVASLPAAGILTPSVLADIAPVLPLGLGWIGLAVGARFDARSMVSLAPGTGRSVFLMIAVPVTVLFFTLVWVLNGLHERWPHEQLPAGQVVRDALLLAIAGAMPARRTPEFLRALLPNRQVPARIETIIELQAIAGVLGLMMLSAYYRPSGPAVAWQLPGTGWLFITLGIGTTIGVLLYATFNRINRNPQFAAVLLGSVAFTAGMASYLRLSPLAVCFIAGAIAINTGGGAWVNEVRSVLERMERPVYFVFMIIAGALWQPWAWQGWALMIPFIAGTFASKRIAAGFLHRQFVPDVSAAERKVLRLAPMGALSVAIVVSAQDLYSGPAVPWLITAVLGGSLVGEVVLQIVARRRRRQLEAGDVAPAPDALPESKVER